MRCRGLFSNILLQIQDGSRKHVGFFINAKNFGLEWRMLTKLARCSNRDDRPKGTYMTKLQIGSRNPTRRPLIFRKKVVVSRQLIEQI